MTTTDRTKIIEALERLADTAKEYHGYAEDSVAAVDEDYDMIRSALESLTTPTPDEEEREELLTLVMDSVWLNTKMPPTTNIADAILAAGYRKVPTEVSDANHGHDALVNGCERCDRYIEALRAALEAARKAVK